MFSDLIVDPTPSEAHIVQLYLSWLKAWQASVSIPSYSLVPRPFPPPVFDRLQYANSEGKDLGDLVTCGDVR